MSEREVVVASVGDLSEGEMKSFAVGEQKVLLSKIGGKIYAVGAHCPHYGAPLEDGALCGDRILCPWHHATFDAKTGDLIEPPSHEALPRFEVRIDGDSILVTLPDEVPASRTPDMARHDATVDGRTFVILGGGAAASSAAQTLREDGFRGRILMITREARPPYDRPNLSKEYLQGNAEPDWMPLRPESFYEDYDITVLLNKEVTGVDVKHHAIEFAHKEPMDFDVLLLATGGIPRTLNVPGASLPNVFTLRSQDDCERIIEQAEEGKRAVLIGASFISMEMAQSLMARKLSVTVVAPETVPFEQILGRELGEMVYKYHKDSGVDFRLKAKATKILGDSRATGIELADGEKIDADFVVLGVGVKPATDFLHGIDLLPDGSLKVDEFFRVTEDVYAAGDIATFTDWRTAQPTRIEHWRVALQQGRYAAHNMVGKETPYRSIPFFWTVQGDIHMVYVGHTHKWDDIIIDGDLQARDFVAYYVTGNEVHAAVGSARQREMDLIEELMRIGKMPKADQLRKGHVDLAGILRP